MKYLGVDYGTQRIGLALATDDTPPVPLMTVSSEQEVMDVIRKEHIDVVVVGRPKSMGGNVKTEIEKKTEEFVNALTSYGLPLMSVVFEDERLTSRGADALKKEFGRSGQRDAVAAMLILDSYLSKSSKSSRASESSQRS